MVTGTITLTVVSFKGTRRELLYNNRIATRTTDFPWKNQQLLLENFPQPLVPRTWFAIGIFDTRYRQNNNWILPAGSNVP